MLFLFRNFHKSMLLSQLRHGDPDLSWCISSSTGITYREWAPGAKVCILLSLGCLNYSSTLVALFPLRFISFLHIMYLWQGSNVFHLVLLIIYHSVVFSFSI